MASVKVKQSLHSNSQERDKMRNPLRRKRVEYILSQKTTFGLWELLDPYQTWLILNEIYVSISP